MKRSRSSLSGASSSFSRRFIDAGSGTRGEGLKRRKAGQACLACRRGKNRCEILETPADKGTLQCYRCKVAGVECSFEFSTIIHVSASGKSTPSSTTLHLPSSPGSSTSRSQQTHKLEDDQTGLCVDDLIPTADVAWGPCRRPGTYDWAEAPFLAIEELLSRTSKGFNYIVPREDRTHFDRQLSDILREEQIERLLEIFDTRYVPWLYQPPRGLDPDPLIDLVSCLIASRHLDPMSQSRVVPRLLKLTEDTFLNQIEHLLPTPISVLALVILSLWVPVGVPENPYVRDSRSLLAAAVNMALRLELPSSVSQMHEIREKVGFSDALHRARLWIWLSSAESALCLASGREPISRRSQIDCRLINVPGLCPKERSRNVRLHYITNLVTLAEAGLQTRLQDPTEFIAFYKSIRDVLHRFDCIRASIDPLHLVSSYDQFFFHILLLQCHGWKLVVLHHAAREMRNVMEGYNGASWTQVELNGCYPGIIYGHDAIHSCQGVLSVFLSERDTACLAALPDCIYTMITFACIFLTTFNFGLMQLRGSHLSSAVERQVVLTIEKLSQTAISPDHMPAKCAHLLAILVGRWERRHKKSKCDLDSPATIEGGLGCIYPFTPDEGAQRQPAPLSQHLGHSTTVALQYIPSMTGFGGPGVGYMDPNINVTLTYPGDQEIFNNPQSWSTFMTDSNMYYAPTDSD